MNEQRARAIASAWHGGQTSALYAFASTGTVTPALIDEIRECMCGVRQHPSGFYGEDDSDLEELADLYAHIRAIVRNEHEVN